MFSNYLIHLSKLSKPSTLCVNKYIYNKSILYKRYFSNNNTDDADFDDIISNDDNNNIDVKQNSHLRNALVLPNVPSPGIMLAARLQKPILPGVMHHVLVQDPTWIKELLHQMKNAVDNIDVASYEAVLNSEDPLNKITEDNDAKIEDKPKVDTIIDNSELYTKIFFGDEGEPIAKPQKKKSKTSHKKDVIVEEEVEESSLSVTDISEVHEIGTMCRAYLHQTQAETKAGQPIALALIGVRRIKIKSKVQDSTPLLVRVEHYHEGPKVKEDEYKAHANEIVETMNKLVALVPSQDILRFIYHAEASNPFFPDLAVYHTNPDSVQLQEILETYSLKERYKKALAAVQKEVEIAKLQLDIRKEMQEKLTGDYKKTLLMDQYRRIRKELGLDKDEKSELWKKFLARVKGKTLPPDAIRVMTESVEKMRSLEPANMEYGQTRSFLELITDLPWGVYTEDNFDIDKAKSILDRDHYGMEKVKDRILEFIAVGNLLKTAAHGKILCLVGPPGVGKTSIGNSIANALNRKFYRIAVGGLDDISEIKGHRKTYVGAMHGKIIQGLKLCQSSNPVFLIDEVDKISLRGRTGDPASALLEVLDPEQNKAFMDHYLDVPYDLSKVLFICTANVEDSIPGPLHDRMEFIRLSGYVAHEKLQIAKNYLIPSALKQTGVPTESIDLQDEAINTLIRQYCREAGVRNLQRRIDQVYRKAALEIVKKQRSGSALEKMIIDPENLNKFVGLPVFTTDRLYDKLVPGVVTGLAWTSHGGATLYTEATISDTRHGGLKASGHLKEIIKESSEVAYTVAKAYLNKIDSTNNFFSNNSIHLHLPEGSTPKDGPSAGVTITTALLSLALNCAVPADLAMTGEITLTGRVLSIGGVKEKAIGAKRSAINTLIFPANNKKDWEELPDIIKEGLTAHFVEWYDDVFSIVFPPNVVADVRESMNKTRLQAVERQNKLIESNYIDEDELGEVDDKNKLKKKKSVRPNLIIPPRFSSVGTNPLTLERQQEEWMSKNITSSSNSGQHSSANMSSNPLGKL